MAWIATEISEDRIVRVHDEHVRWHGWQCNRPVSAFEAARFLMLIGRRQADAPLEISSLSDTWQAAFREAQAELLRQNATPRANLMS